MPRLKRVLLNALLFPIIPAIQFGPFTHPYVNRKALRIAEKDVAQNGGSKVNKELLGLLVENETAFVNAGNSADAISTYHVIKGIDLYDYAHNYHPDNASGTPTFGYTLLDEWYQSRGTYPEGHAAIAAGWLAHQVADWYPHHACVNADGTLGGDPNKIADEIRCFSGFADAFTIFGPDLPKEMRSRYKDANHALYELFLDLWVLEQPDAGAIFNTMVNLFDHGSNSRTLLTACSERFVDCMRIPPEHIPSLERDFNTVITGTWVLIKTLVRLYPSLSQDLKAVVQPDIVDRAARRVFQEVLCKSWDEIACAARQADAGQPVLRESLAGLATGKLSKIGTTLFSCLYQIGAWLKKDMSRKELAHLVEEPVEALLSLVARKYSWGIELADSILEGLGRDVDDAVYGGLRHTVQRLTGSSKGQSKELSPVLAFLSGLLLTSERPSLSDARETMRRNLRPMIVPEPQDGSNLTLEHALEGMFRSGLIRVRAIPAIADSYTEEMKNEKRLKEETLIVRVDGHNLAEDTSVGRYEVSRDETGCLHIAISIRPQVQPGVHHLFVDIRDVAGVHSEYIDHRVVVRS